MTNTRIALVPTIVLCVVLCHCGDPCSPPEPGSFGAYVSNVAGGIVDGFFGAPVSSLPNQQCVEPAPNLDEQAIGSGSGGACAAASGDDACVTCAKTSCCAVSLSCWKEDTCTCLVACRTVGCTSDQTAKCGEPDAAFDAVLGCITDHCAKECPSM